MPFKQFNEPGQNQICILHSEFYGIVVSIVVMLLLSVISLTTTVAYYRKIQNLNAKVRLLTKLSERNYFKVRSNLATLGGSPPPQMVGFPSHFRTRQMPVTCPSLLPPIQASPSGNWPECPPSTCKTWGNAAGLRISTTADTPRKRPPSDSMIDRRRDVCIAIDEGKKYSFSTDFKTHHNKSSLSREPSFLFLIQSTYCLYVHSTVNLICPYVEHLRLLVLLDFFLMLCLSFWSFVPESPVDVEQLLFPCPVRTVRAKVGLQSEMSGNDL